MKSQLGYNCTHVHSIQALYSRYLICFVAIIRNKIREAAKKIDINTNNIISKLDRIKIILKDDLYIPVFNISDELQLFLKNVNLSQSSLGFFANDYNERLTNSIKSQIRTLPVTIKHLINQDSNLSFDNNIVQNKGKGRKKGSRNQKTLLREQVLKTLVLILYKKAIEIQAHNDKNAKEALVIANYFASPHSIGNKKKCNIVEETCRGRKKGSRNKKTLLREKLLKTLILIAYKKVIKLQAQGDENANVALNKNNLFKFYHSNEDKKEKIVISSTKGRKKGTRNQKTLLREQLLKTLLLIVYKKGIELKAQGDEDANKALLIANKLASPHSFDKAKDKTNQKSTRGRKKGSRNKKTLLRIQFIITLVSIMKIKEKLLKVQNDFSA